MCPLLAHAQQLLHRYRSRFYTMAVRPAKDEDCSMKSREVLPYPVFNALCAKMNLPPLVVALMYSEHFQGRPREGHAT